MGKGRWALPARTFRRFWRGSVADAAEAISRAYAKFGYERRRKAPGEGGKQVILLTRVGEGVAWRAC